MRQSSRTASHLSPGSQSIVAERVIAFLRGRHAYKIPEAIQAETGIPAGTVQKWLDRGSAPSAFAIFRLIGVYGPEFVAAVMADPPDWLDRAAREAAAGQLKAEIAAREAKLARLAR